jgi:hypothetical protein
MGPRLANFAFHHIGLAVKDDGPALVYLKALGYAPGERVFDARQNVHVRLCVLEGQPAVELVQPGPEGPSPVDMIISRFNEMMYHSCYEVPDALKAVEELKALGLRVQTLSPPQPAILFGGRHVSFHRVQGVGIIEFLEP